MKKTLEKIKEDFRIAPVTFILGVFIKGIATTMVLSLVLFLLYLLGLAIFNHFTIIILLLIFSFIAGVIVHYAEYLK